MPPAVSQNVSNPPGVLPKNVRFIVLAAITLLIVISSFFSGNSAKRKEVQPPSVAPGPNQSQLSMFTEMLEKQRRAAAEEKSRLDAARQSEEQRRALAAMAPQVPP